MINFPRKFLVIGALMFLPTLGFCLTNGSKIFSSTVAPTTAEVNPAITFVELNRPELRAVWVHPWSVTSREKVDNTLRRVEVGRFTAIFVNVFVYGQTLYASDVAQKYKEVEHGFNPLAYLIEEAHHRNIQVHAWLVAGPVGGVDGPILSIHPEWGMVSLDGEKANWLNYNRPDVRQFIADISLEIVRNYKVDGIHFDYTRYPHPGWKWGFDSYSAERFTEEYGVALEMLRYAELPAYGSFRSNSLAGITTAQVLAVFDDGQPAVLRNRYEAGEAILFNWQADERTIAASSEILRRSISYLLDETGKLYILRSATNAEKYGYNDFERGVTWLEDIGLSPLEISEANLATLDLNDVLIMPSVYLIEAQVAANLANFVKQGGGIIFIDGPTPSIKDKNIQAIVGMQTQGKYFERSGLLIPVGKYTLIPRREQTLKLDDYTALDAQWKTFRQQGINRLLQDVYHQVKREAPGVLVTITVAGNQNTLAEKHFLDWQAWLDGGYIDLLIPRAYVEQDQPLEPVIADWQPAIDGSGRVLLGLSVYTDERSKEGKTAAQLLSEIDLAYANGSQGIILFNLEGLSDATLKALASDSAGP